MISSSVSSVRVRVHSANLTLTLTLTLPSTPTYNGSNYWENFHMLIHTGSVHVQASSSGLVHDREGVFYVSLSCLLYDLL